MQGGEGLSNCLGPLLGVGVKHMIRLQPPEGLTKVQEKVWDAEIIGLGGVGCRRMLKKRRPDSGGPLLARVQSQPPILSCSKPDKVSLRFSRAGASQTLAVAAAGLRRSR